MKSTVTMAALLLILIAFGTGCTDTVAPAAPTPVYVDTAPPAVPTGLWTTPTIHRVVKLAWKANATDNDLAGYQVYRMVHGQIVQLNASPITEPRFIDEAPLPGACIYAVTSIDDSGNESGWVQVRHNVETEDAEVRVELP